MKVKELEKQQRREGGRKEEAKAEGKGEGEGEGEEGKEGRETEYISIKQIEDLEQLRGSKTQQKYIKSYFYDNIKSIPFSLFDKRQIVRYSSVELENSPQSLKLLIENEILNSRYSKEEQSEEYYRLIHSEKWNFFSGFQFFLSKYEHSPLSIDLLFNSLYTNPSPSSLPPSSSFSTSFSPLSFPGESSIPVPMFSSFSSKPVGKGEVECSRVIVDVHKLNKLISFFKSNPSLGTEPSSSSSPNHPPDFNSSHPPPPNPPRNNEDEELYNIWSNDPPTLFRLVFLLNHFLFFSLPSPPLPFPLLFVLFHLPSITLGIFST